VNAGLLEELLQVAEALGELGVAGGVELAADDGPGVVGLLGGGRVELGDALGQGAAGQAAGEHGQDAVTHDGGEAAELAGDGVALGGEAREHGVFGQVLVPEVVAPHLGRRLQHAVDAAVALLDAGGVPREVEVEEVGAVGLEVDALARGVGGHEDAQGVLLGVGVEGRFEGLALVLVLRPVQAADARVVAVGALDGPAELIDQPRARVGKLREHDHPPGQPGRVFGVGRSEGCERRALVLPHPVDEGLHPRVGLVGGGLGEGGHLREQGADAVVGEGREASGVAGGLGVEAHERRGLGLVVVFVGAGLGGREAVEDGAGCLLAVGAEGALEGVHRRQEALAEALDGDAHAALGLEVGVGAAGGEGVVVAGEEGGEAQLVGLVGRVGEGHLHEPALGQGDVRMPSDVGLEAPHHDGRELGRAADVDAARKPLRIEDVHERRERVGVAVVGRGGEEEPVLEALREVAHGAGDLGVDGVAAGRGGGGDVGLVEHEHGARGEVSEGVAEAREVLLVAEEGVRHDEEAAGRPGVDAEAAGAPAREDKLAVVQGELEAEALPELVAPLEGDGGRRGDDGAVDALPEEELVQDETGFDGLSEAHVVGDEEVDAGQGEGLAERFELVGVGDDAGAERGLKQGRVGGGDAAPAQRVEVGREAFGGVGLAGASGGAGVVEDAGVGFGLPEHGEAFALGVVLDAGEREAGERLEGLAALDEPAPLAHAHEAAGGGHEARRGRGRAIRHGAAEDTASAPQGGSKSVVGRSAPYNRSAAWTESVA
jgi:hypothetical protein